MKPILFQQYKKQMISKCSQKQGKRKACATYIIHSLIRRVCKQLKRNFGIHRQLKKQSNRQVWCGILINIHFRRRIRMLGKDMATRIRRNITISSWY